MKNRVITISREFGGVGAPVERAVFGDHRENVFQHSPGVVLTQGGGDGVDFDGPFAEGVKLETERGEACSGRSTPSERAARFMASATASRTVMETSNSLRKRISRFAG